MFTSITAAFTSFTPQLVVHVQKWRARRYGAVRRNGVCLLCADAVPESLRRSTSSRIAIPSPGVATGESSLRLGSEQPA